VWRPDPVVPGLYAGEFFDDAGYYSSYFSRQDQWRHEARLRLAWLLRSDRPARLLEVGCAGGFFLEAARAEGIEVFGVEPSEDGSHFARSELGLPVLTSAFEDAEIPGLFDALCGFHVLEHVPDAGGFLARARQLLAPRGLLALEVPNIDSARARRDGAQWFNLVPDFHCWHFSPPTLRRLVEQAGFVVERIDTALPRHYLRARRVFTRSGLRSLTADLRAFPRLRRTHPTAGDYLRLTARVPDG
jgi:SAM-dependent methyltransferase